MKSEERKSEQPSAADVSDRQSRRATLRRLGRFAVITPPAVTLLLAARTKPAAAVVSGPPVSSRQFKEPVSVARLRRVA